MDQRFTEKEIQEGVIEAICPGPVLRSYLETYSDLMSNRLHKIIQSHYGVNDTAEFYKNFASLGQGPKEYSYIKKSFLQVISAFKTGRV